MGFLIKSAFWLGVTFSCMDWHGEPPKLPTAGETATRITQVCATSPDLCLAAAARIEALRTATGMAAPPIAPPPKITPSSDTLRANDRAPPWRGRG
jgi:hypothetical protein